MIKVRFNSIIIYDIQKQRGFKQTFKPGINIVTSTENHVGKSCLVKSLYYALGAEVNYDQNWDVKSKTFCLAFCVNDKHYQIIRKNKSFLLIDNKNNTNFCTHASTELNFILKNIFKFGVYLSNKKTKKLELTPPAFTYLPYFIDQDKGWTTEIFSSFENLAQYNALDRRSSVLYHYNVRNENTVNTENSLIDEKEKAEATKNEKKELEKTLCILEKEARGIKIAGDVAELAKVMEYSRKQTEELLNQMFASRNRIQQLQEDVSFYSMRLKQIKFNTKIDSNNDTVEIKKCSHCGYIDNESIYDFANQAFYKKNKRYITKQVQTHLSNLSNELEKEKNQYNSLHQSLKQNYIEISEKNHGYESYIRYQGLESSMQDLNIRINQLEKQINSIEASIKSLNTQKKNISKQDSDVNKKYESYARQFLSQLGAEIEDDNEIDISLLLKKRAQGTILPKTLIALHAAILETIRSLNTTIMFPFVVDSPCTMEASGNSRVEILGFLHRLNYLPQIIISTVDYHKYNPNTESNFNLIELSRSRSLLSDVEYSEIKEEIDEIENKFKIAQKMYISINNKGK